MKAISLTQPWATLVALRQKRIETRSWSTPYRGPIAIHAAKNFPAECRGLAESEPFSEALRSHWKPLPLGKVVAVAQLVDVREILTGEDVILLNRLGLPRWEFHFGDYTKGRFAWVLANVKALDEPIHARGMLGVWEWAAPEWVAP